MKVNIICGGHAITGYVNIDPLAKNEPDKIAADFGNLDNLIHDSEATEILATEVVHYIPFTSVPKVLENWAKKLRINGKISVGGYDVTEACKSYANKTCSLEDLNILLRQSMDESDGRASMALVEIIGKVETEYNQCVKRQQTLLNDLKEKRSDRLKKRQVYRTHV